MPCNYCDRIFTNRSNMLKHVAETHEGRQLNCNQCSYNTSSKDKLTYHKTNEHPLVMYKCKVETCQYTFPTAKKLSLHQLEVHEEKKLHCQDCNQKFAILCS